MDERLIDYSDFRIICFKVSLLQSWPHFIRNNWVQVSLLRNVYWFLVFNTNGWTVSASINRLRRLNAAKILLRAQLSDWSLAIFHVFKTLLNTLLKTCKKKNCRSIIFSKFCETKTADFCFRLGTAQELLWAARTNRFILRLKFGAFFSCIKSNQYTCNQRQTEKLLV